MEGKLENDERITVKEVIESIIELFQYLFSKWKPIIIGTTLIASVLIGYQLLTKRQYTAETTFVVESGKGQNQDFSSLASVVGIPLGGMSSSNKLFNSDNILLLSKSTKILRETFLERVQIEGDSKERLITFYARKNGKLANWEQKFKDFSFEVEESEMTVTHDSLLLIVIDTFRKKKLTADRVDRRLDILSIKVQDHLPVFAKTFNEVLVQKVNEFYIETKTLKSGFSLNILQKQADSVKRMMDWTLQQRARLTEKIPNANVLKSSIGLDRQKSEVDVRMTSVVLEEVVRELEVAKIKHLQSTPIIQIVDQPILPLPHDKPRKLMILFVGFVAGGTLMVGFFTIKRVYISIMK